MVGFKRGKENIQHFNLEFLLPDPDPVDLKECGSMRIWIRIPNTVLYPVYRRNSKAAGGGGGRESERERESYERNGVRE
jgi:hypothetical protein